jgi:phosphoribosylanthranilate isomerase
MIVKVCGVTSQADALAAIDAGANALGFNFWQGSPRYLDPEAADFIPALPVLKVGVFVDCAAIEVAKIATRLQLDVVTAGASGTCRSSVLARRPVRDGFDTATSDQGAEAYLPMPPPALTAAPARPSIDHSQRPPHRRGRRTHASNVAMAISTARPWGVDLLTSRVRPWPGRPC